jgi:hypothetical protein
MDEREEELVRMLQRVKLESNGRIYLTQKNLAQDLEEITRNLTAAVRRASRGTTLSTQAQTELRTIYQKWRRYYLEHYHSTLFRRVDAKYFEPEMQKRYKFNGYETYYEDIWKRTSSKAEAQRKQSGIKDSSGILKEGLAQEVNDTEFSFIFGNNQEGATKEGTPRLTGLIKLLQPQLDEETILFGKFAENRVTILFGIELIKLYSLVYSEEIPECTNIPTSQCEIITQFVKETFTLNLICSSEVNGIGTDILLKRNWCRMISEILKYWKLKKDPPTIGELFEVTHLYTYVEILLSQLTTLTGQPPLLGVPRPIVLPSIFSQEIKPIFDIESILNTYSKTMINTTTISDEIENYLIAFICVPHLKECYITNQVSSDNPRHISNRPRIRANMDENFTKTLRYYQKELWADVRKNEMMALHLDWSIILNRDMRFRKIFLFIEFHFFILENYQFPYWLHRTVIFFDIFWTDPKTYMKNSEVVPYFVQCQPNDFQLLFNGEFFQCENHGNLLYTYLKIIEDSCESKLPLETDIMKCAPQYYGFKRNLPYHSGTESDVWKSDVMLTGILDKFKELHFKLIEEERNRNSHVRQQELEMRIDQGGGISAEEIHSMRDLSFKETLSRIQSKFNKKK